MLLLLCLVVYGVSGEPSWADDPVLESSDDDSSSDLAQLFGSRDDDEGMTEPGDLCIGCQCPAIGPKECVKDNHLCNSFETCCKGICTSMITGVYLGYHGVCLPLHANGYTKQQGTILAKSYGILNRKVRCSTGRGSSGFSRFGRNFVRVMGHLNPTRWVRRRGCVGVSNMVSTKRRVQPQLPVSEIKTGDLVQTTQGYEKVLWVGEEAQPALTLNASLASGRWVSATPNHLVYTKDGVVRMESVKAGTELFVQREGQLVPDRVLGVTARLDMVRNPVTPSGEILLNSVQFSTYTASTVYLQPWAAVLYRFVFRFLPPGAAEFAVAIGPALAGVSL